MYLCMYVCMYVCMFVCMHVCMCFGVSVFRVCLVGDGGEKLFEAHLEAICPLQFRCAYSSRFKVWGLEFEIVEADCPLQFRSRNVSTQRGVEKSWPLN